MTSISEEAKSAIGLFNTIYTSTDTELISHTIKQIEVWEQSERPWKVCAEILQGDISALSGEALLFFVNVIHKKLRHDYAQLPGSAPAELRQVILRAIFNVHKAISSNASNARGLRKAAVVLGACIAALALHMRGSGAWPDPAADTIASFREAGAPGYALEALAKMPEEATSQDVCVGRPQRDAFNVYLSDAVPGVFRFLTETLKGSGADVGVQEAAFQCIYAWLKYCTFSYDDLKASPIVPALFLGLSHPALFSVAVDAICEAVSVAGSLNGSTEEGEDPLRDYFIDAAIALAPQYADAVRQGDLDRATGYARIYGDAGCSYAQYLVRCTAPRALQFTEVAVEVARHPDREVHLLVLAYFDELAAAVNAALPEQRLALASPFVPHVRRLVGHLIGHLVLPADLAPVFCSDDSCNGDNGSNTGNGKGGGEEEEEEEGGNGDKEDVARYRKYDIGQCLSAYCALAAPSGVLGVAMQAFSEALTHLSTDWRPAEAAVYALQCVAARASPPCSELAPLLKPFLDAAPGLLVPSGARGSAALRRTALVAVGAYAGYFRGAAFLPQLLDGVATALGAGPALRPAAAVAFARLCDACAADLSPYAAQFETLYGRCCGQLQPPLALTARQAEDVAQGLCSVILAMPRGKAAPLLDAYCAATATELQAAVQAAATAAAAASAGSATPALLGVLGRLRVFLSCAASWAGSSCEPGTLAAAGQRVVACLRTVFPAVGALVAAGPQLCTPEVVGAVVSVYDAAIGTSERTAGFVESILPGMFEAPVRHYTAQPNALDLSFANGILTRLKLASDAVTNPVVRNILVSVLATVVAATTQFLGNTRGAAQEHPDLIEGFFGFMDTFASKHPGLVAAQGTILQDTVAMAAAVLALTQHPGATRIICAFLCTVLRAAHTVQALRAPVDCCLLRLGARVVHALLCGVAGAQPKDFVHSAATVVFQVRAYSRDTLLALVAACLELQQPPPQFTSCGKFPVALDQETRTMFLTKLQKAASSKNVENVMNDFGFACRSLITAL